MRNVVLMMTTSIDGYVAAPHGHAGGMPEPEELKHWKLDRIRRAGTHIMGRVTYEEMASFWPTSSDDYAAPMNEIPKVVFSKTLQDATWPESSVASGDLADEIATLRRQPGGEIIAWGGAGFAQAVSRAGLVNEYVIVTQPVAYGGGLPLFRDLPDALHLKVVEAKTFSSGTMLHIYAPRGWGRELAQMSGPVVLPRRMRTLHSAYRAMDLTASFDFYTALGYGEVGGVDIGDGASLTPR